MLDIKDDLLSIMQSSVIESKDNRLRSVVFFFFSFPFLIIHHVHCRSGMKEVSTCII